MKKPLTKELAITDEGLLAFLDAKEAGKSFPDALAASGLTRLSQEDTGILRSYWDMHGDFMRTAHNIAPSTALLSRIVEMAGEESDAPVTAQAGAGYIGGTGRTRNIRINDYLQNFMQINWRIAAPIAVLVVAVVSVLGVGSVMKNDVMPSQLAVNDDASLAKSAMRDVQEGEGIGMAIMAVSASPVTGNADDLVALLLREADGDAALFDDSAEDVALIESDGIALVDFTTIYDENTF